MLRYKHYSLKTEQAYAYWVKFFVRWCGRSGQMRHPRDMGSAEVMDGEASLLAKLLYGTGMRLMEGLRLRIKDVDFDRQVLMVRQSEGGKGGD